MTNDELIPCPFCGSNAELERYRDTNLWRVRSFCSSYKSRCPAAAGTIWVESRDEAINLWNSRFCQGDPVERALDLAFDYGQTDGEHHKLWVIDQMVRILTGDKYHEFVHSYRTETSTWETGIAP